MKKREFYATIQIVNNNVGGIRDCGCDAVATGLSGVKKFSMMNKSSSSMLFFFFIRELAQSD